MGGVWGKDGVISGKMTVMGRLLRIGCCVEIGSSMIGTLVAAISTSDNCYMHVKDLMIMDIMDMIVDIIVFQLPSLLCPSGLF